MSFVRKVLGIVGFQLVITLGMCIAASMYDSFGDFCGSLPVYITSIFVYLFSFIALFCSRGLRFSVPGNYIMLFLFTVSMGFMISALCAFLTPQSVIMAIGVLALVLSCLFFAMLATPNMAKAVMGVMIGILACCIL